MKLNLPTPSITKIIDNFLCYNYFWLCELSILRNIKKKIKWYELMEALSHPPSLLYKTGNKSETNGILVTVSAIREVPSSLILSCLKKKAGDADLYFTPYLYVTIELPYYITD